MDTTTSFQTTYPSDVSDEEWAIVLPYVTLMEPDASQRKYPLRALFKGLRWMVRAGAPWRMLPRDLPPWHAVHEQTQRWIRAGCFERLVEDLRVLIRLGEERAPQPSAVIVIAGRRSRRRSVGVALPGTATSGGKARRCTWWSTRSATCWRFA